MPSQSSDSIGYILLGAILALTTSLVTEIYKNWVKNKDSEKDFKIILKLELKSVLETIDKLIEDYGQKQYYPFAILTELSSKIFRLDKIREKVIYIKDDTRKEEILSLINDISSYYSKTLTLEQLAFNPSQRPDSSPATPWNDEIYKSQRQMIALEGTDLKRIIQDSINYLER